MENSKMGFWAHRGEIRARNILYESNDVLHTD